MHIEIKSYLQSCIKFKKYLKLHSIPFSNQNEDSRINSCMYEPVVIELLVTEFGEKNKKTQPRMWYDILALDHMY